MELYLYLVPSALSRWRIGSRRYFPFTTSSFVGGGAANEFVSGIRNNVIIPSDSQILLIITLPILSGTVRVGLYTA